MKALATLTLATLMAGAAPLASAQDHAHAGHGAHQAHATHDAAAAPTLAEGEVRKVDKEAGKVTLRHGEIRNLNMAAMTMVLRVQDAAMLDQVKVGDKVRFAAERMNGAVTIVRMQKAE